MGGPLLLGVDVGTSSTKGVLADVHGHHFATATTRYAYRHSSPAYAEQDPQDWWDAVCHVIRSLLAQNPGAKDRIAGIGVSGQGVAAVLIGKDGKPLRDAILWLDMRCAEYAAALSEKHGKALLESSGKLPAAYNVEPKLLWLREHESEAWKKVWKVLTTTAYINFRLTGHAVMNYSDAGIMLSWDLERSCWSEDAMACTGLEREIFCEAVPCHEVIGGISKSASDECGLPEGIPVIAGGEDTSSAGLAMGIVSGQEVQLSMGLAGTIYVPFSRSVHDARLLAFPHVLEGVTLLGGSMVAGGLAFDWLRKVLRDAGSDETEADWMRRLTAEAEAVPAGARGLIFLPYLSGELQPVNDGFARGVLLGLTASSGQPEIFRAVMEGTAFAIEHNLRIAREAGAAPSRVIAVGGPTRNDLWCQIVSDVTGMPMDVMEDRGGAALGDAVLAGMGVNLFRDPLEMQRAHARTRKRFAPCRTSHEKYQQQCEIYQEVYPRLKDIFPKLSVLANQSAEDIVHVHI